MAWTTPTTHSTGDLITASNWNTDLVNNLKYLHGDAGIIQIINDLANGPTSGAAGGGGNAGLYLAGGGTLSSVAAAGGTTGFVVSQTTDTGYRWTVDHTGANAYGPGNAATDVTTSRSTGGALKVGNVVRQTRGALTYSASMTPDCTTAEWQTITATNNTAFTINAPTNPPASTETQWLTIEIFNNSGGALGAVTWNAAFVFTPIGAAPAQPANTKRRYATFKWHGSAWICQAFATNDY